MRFFFNIYQTFVLFDMRPMYTVNTKGEKAVDVRTSRSNANLGCTLIATGGKLPAQITRSFPRRGFVQQLAALEDNMPANVIVTTSAPGWMKEETIHHWLDEVLTTRP
jgi:hypothetical protein